MLIVFSSIILHSVVHAYTHCHISSMYPVVAFYVCSSYTIILNWICINPVPLIVPIYHTTNPHILSLMSFFHSHSRCKCNFGPDDKTDIVPHDMQALLISTQKKEKAEDVAEEDRTGICDFRCDQINPSKGNAHWQDIIRQFHEARVPTLFCCEVALRGPLVVFAHLRKCRRFECCWRTLPWHHGWWI